MHRGPCNLAEHPLESKKEIAQRSLAGGRRTEAAALAGFRRRRSTDGDGGAEGEILTATCMGMQGGRGDDED